MFQQLRSRRVPADFLRAVSLGSICLFAVSATALFAPAAVAQQQAPLLTLDEALRRSVEFDPGQRAASASIDAARGGLRQAGVRSNPTIDAEVENFGGQGDLSGLRGAETTLSLSREIDFGGQRKARIAVADRELHGAELERVIRGLDLIRDVQLAYYEALAAQELAAIERERLAAAEALARSVDRRVSAARDPLMAGVRANAGVAEARIALTRAEAEAVTARARLASFFGGGDGFALDPGDFALPPAQDHDHQIPHDQTPDLARLTAAREQADADIRLQRSLAYQNPTLSLGYRRFEDRDGQGAVVAGFSIPLGVSNRNRGAIERAEAERRRAVSELEAARLALLREFAALERGRASDAQAVRATEEQVIPEALRALALAQEGYDRGAFSYLDVFEAQRALTDARQSRVEALTSLHRNEADLDRLTARFAEVIPGEEIHQ